LRKRIVGPSASAAIVKNEAPLALCRAALGSDSLRSLFLTGLVIVYVHSLGS